MENSVVNRVYSLVKKSDVLNKKKHFTYGWASNPWDVVNYFNEQKALPKSDRYVKSGEYVILFSDRDSGEFDYAAFCNEPFYIRPPLIME